MSTPQEQLETIKHSVEIAKRRLEELNAKPSLTRSELYERDMTVACISRGMRILGSVEKKP